MEDMVDALLIPRLIGALLLQRLVDALFLLDDVKMEDVKIEHIMIGDLRYRMLR